MKKYIDAIKAWNESRKLKRNQRLFMRLHKNPKSGMAQVVEEAAGKVAARKMMMWLDAKRFVHCVLCPNTDSLRNHPLRQSEKLCPGHYDRVVPKVETKKPTEKQEAHHG